MNLRSFVDGLTVEEREELLDILVNSVEQSTTMPPHIKEEVQEQPHRVQDDFTMHKSKGNSLKNNSRRSPVKAGANTWTDTGEHRDVSTPDVQRTPRNRAAPKKKKVTCNACGKTSHINASIVYGEYYRCDRCVGK